MWPLPDDGFFPHFDSRGDDLDARLARQVRDRLGAGDRGLRVDVQNGVVLLSGSAASPAARRAALRSARSVPGVREVCNRVHVADDAEVIPATGPTEPETDRVFAEIVAGILELRPPCPPRRRRPPVAWVVAVLLSLVWAGTSVVVLAAGGAGAAAACQVLAVIVAVTLVRRRIRRRRSRRIGRTG
jgi:hypothetical protein